MSYDIRIRVKAEGCDKYPVIAIPTYDSPTYNLGKMFRACMDWDFSQSERNKVGTYQCHYYRCDLIMPKIERGIRELSENKNKYTQYNPENGWGTLEGALDCLRSIKECILEQTEEIPLECLYMSW